MNKKPVTITTHELAPLITELRGLIHSARHEERSFYEIESTQAGWSLPELKRQLASGLYGRLALTLPVDANIHAREYQLYLPSKELLRQKLLDWALEQKTGKRP